jgi:hypothetical protein
MFNIFTHKENANKYIIGILFHTSQNGFHQSISSNNKCWGGCGGKGCLIHCWWECKLVQTPKKSVWRLIKKLKIDLLFDPVYHARETPAHTYAWQHYSK